MESKPFVVPLGRSKMKVQLSEELLDDRLSLGDRAAVALAFIHENAVRVKNGNAENSNGKVLASWIKKGRRLPLPGFLALYYMKVLFQPMSYALKLELSNEIDTRKLLNELEGMGYTKDDILNSIKAVDPSLENFQYEELENLGPRRMPQVGQQNAPLLIKTEINGQKHFVLIQKGKDTNKAGKVAIPGNQVNKSQIEGSKNYTKRPLWANALAALQKIGIPVESAKFYGSKHPRPLFLIVNEDGKPGYRNFVYGVEIPLKDVPKKDAVLVPATREGINQFFREVPEGERVSYLEPLLKAEVARVEREQSVEALKQSLALTGRAVKRAGRSLFGGKEGVSKEWRFFAERIRAKGKGPKEGKVRGA